MLAMKSVGIATSSIGLVYGLLITKAISFEAPYVEWANIAAPDLAAGLTLAVSVGLLGAWLFYFNESAVRRVGFAYAERLFECLTTLKVAGAAKSQKRGATS
jgi:hypothetical protein